MYTTEHLDRLADYSARVRDADARDLRTLVSTKSGWIRPEVDVVVGGDGISALTYGPLMAQSGLDTIMIGPGVDDPGASDRHGWNMARDELLNLSLIMSPHEIAACTDGYFEEGIFAFHGSEPYIAKDVLNVCISPERLKTALMGRFLRTGGSTIAARVEHVAVYKNGVVVITEDDEITSRAFLHGFGAEDGIHMALNRGRDDDLVYSVVGIMADYENSKAPRGDILRTLADAEHGAQILLENFSPEFDRFGVPLENAPAVSYVFKLAHGKQDLAELALQTQELLLKYHGEAPSKVHKVVGGFIPIIRDIRGVRRSAGQGIRVIGENDGCSPLAGTGAAAIVKGLKYQGQDIVSAIKEGKLSQAYLNSLKPDQKFMSTWALQRLFAETMLVNKGERPNDPNLQCGRLFGNLSLVDDVDGRERMLKDEIMAGVLSEYIIKSFQKGDGRELLQTVAINNGMELPKNLAIILREYGILTARELEHAVVHATRGETVQARGHIKRLNAALNPELGSLVLKELQRNL